MIAKSSTLLVVSLLVACSFVQWMQHVSTPPTSRELSIPSFKTYIDGNGTLQVGRKPDPIACRYFVSHHQQLDTGKQEEETFLVPPGVEIKKLHFHFEDCAEHQLGNRLGEHYLNYMIANAARIPYQMTCGDDDSVLQIIDPTHEKRPHESVLKRLEVDLAEPGPVPLDSWGGQPWSVAAACSHCCRGGWWCNVGLDTMVHPVIVSDMRKLAATAAAPFEPDEIVIHLRLGDALRGKHDEGIGLLPHQAYTQILEQVQQGEDGVVVPIKSIGIVTQPFHKSLVRSFDLNDITLQKSKLVAYDLVDHLRSRFPSAIVTIHNGVNEIPLVSYARLIRATRAAICGPSTFCTMPVLATAKEGFIFRAEKHSPWAQHVASTAANRPRIKDAAKIHSYKVPRLANNYTSVLSGEEIVHWLRHQSPQAGEFIISGPPLVRNAPKYGADGTTPVNVVGDAS